MGHLSKGTSMRKNIANIDKLKLAIFLGTLFVYLIWVPAMIIIEVLR